MAYGEDLAHRVGARLSGDQLMVRVGADPTDNALARPHTRGFDMTRGPRKGWILVAPDGVKTSRQLGEWVRRGVQFAGSLPPKG
jgi:hypothetical protein